MNYIKLTDMLVYLTTPLADAEVLLQVTMRTSLGWAFT